jgi:hypothetical protein
MLSGLIRYTSAELNIAIIGSGFRRGILGAAINYENYIAGWMQLVHHGFECCHSAYVPMYWSLPRYT